MAPKIWHEKLGDAARPEIKRAPRDIAGMKAGQIMLVPTARMIDRFIRRLPAGTSMDVQRMCALLAKRHGAQVTCPIYTGFHLRTVAEAAFEAYERGAPLSAITPFGGLSTATRRPHLASPAAWRSSGAGGAKKGSRHRRGAVYFFSGRIGAARLVSPWASFCCSSLLSAATVPPLRWITELNSSRCVKIMLTPSTSTSTIL
jgi:hypothetical protein